MTATACECRPHVFVVLNIPISFDCSHFFRLLPETKKGTASQSLLQQGSLYFVVSPSLELA